MEEASVFCNNFAPFSLSSELLRGAELFGGTTRLKNLGGNSSSTPARAPGGTGKASTGRFGRWWCLFRFGFGNTL